MQIYPMRIASWIGLPLSGTALIMSVSGLYGVVTYSLSQRTREIGIHVALGASAAAVVRLFMGQSARLVSIGAGLGLLVSFTALAILQAVSSLQNLSILDPAAFRGRHSGNRRHPCRVFSRRSGRRGSIRRTRTARCLRQRGLARRWTESGQVEALHARADCPPGGGKTSARHTGRGDQNVASAVALN
jgi:hypothetical protein